ncbi:MAG: T9SS type A sorting domain-containing protein [Bacteroidetes bacterium]|nr:T9SS type A sorting domain-containing protein [Bacteroidota bacterium]
MKSILSICFIFILQIGVTKTIHAQLPTPSLVGYWHNWNDTSAPYIPLTAIDNRYNVIEISFAVPVSPQDMTMTFIPDNITVPAFISQVQSLQAAGKKVLLSIGGANAFIDLTTTVNRDAFIASMTNLLMTYGFDGMDIDIEHGNAITITGGTIASPTNISQQHLIVAIQQIMQNYRTTFGNKMLLTMAPETAYVTGGMSAYGGIWGGYLPIINALRDSIDMLHMQLYNSGSMYGIDGGIYTQGNADFIVAMTEAVVQGFQTGGGFFQGLPAHKIAVGLPACGNAAGGGFVNDVTVKSAIDYIRGNGPKPGLYTLTNTYPDLGGMMTWSINWDAVNTCETSYNYAINFELIFGTPTALSELNSSENTVKLFPNPSNGNFYIQSKISSAELIITDITGKTIYADQHFAEMQQVVLPEQGIFLIQLRTESEVLNGKIIITK